MLATAVRPAPTGPSAADVYQCPFCELRFVTIPELNMHIQLDHPDREVPEREY